eukprot:5822389-Pleurochrysis_carterae.AAC.2
MTFLRQREVHSVRQGPRGRRDTHAHECTAHASGCPHCGCAQSVRAHTPSLHGESAPAGCCSRATRGSFTTSPRSSSPGMADWAAATDQSAQTRIEGRAR